MYHGIGRLPIAALSLLQLLSLWELRSLRHFVDLHLLSQATSQQCPCQEWSGGKGRDFGTSPSAQTPAHSPTPTTAPSTALAPPTPLACLRWRRPSAAERVKSEGNRKREEGHPLFESILAPIARGSLSNLSSLQASESAADVMFAASEDVELGTGYEPPHSRGVFIRTRSNVWISLWDVLRAYDIFFERVTLFSVTEYLGVCCQQDPIDAWMIQEMITRVKPDLIIEIGTNAGGGAVFYSHIQRVFKPDGIVLTLDILPLYDFNAPRVRSFAKADKGFNCSLGNRHPFWDGKRIIQELGNIGADASFREKIKAKYVDGAGTVLVIDDASHGYSSTLENIKSTMRFVTPGSYFLVQDTKLTHLLNFQGPLAALRDLETDEYWRTHFTRDRTFEKLFYSQHHGGFYKRSS